MPSTTRSGKTRGDGDALTSGKAPPSKRPRRSRSKAGSTSSNEDQANADNVMQDGDCLEAAVDVGVELASVTPPPLEENGSNGDASKSVARTPASSSLKIVNPRSLEGRASTFSRNVTFSADRGDVKNLRINTTNFAGGFSFMSPYRFNATNCVPTPHTPRARVLVADAAERDEQLFSVVQEGNDKKLRQMLKEDKTRIDAKEKEHGYSLLMTAAALGKTKGGYDKCSTLVEFGADMTQRDDDGYTCLHWAAALGHVDTVRLLAVAMKRAGTPAADGIDAKAENGDTALHRAARFNLDECVKALIEEGASYTVQNNDFYMPFDVIGSFSAASPSKSAKFKARLRTRDQFYESAPYHRTLILHHPDCLDHVTAKGHQEAPARVTAILEKLGTITEPKSILVNSEFGFASTEMLTYAHSNTYVSFIHELHNQVIASMKSVPFTPHVQRGALHFEENDVKAEKGCDTTFSPGTLRAALRAAGAVCHAVDMVVSGKSRNSFCVTRPPGHHAGVTGLLHNAVSCGFCIFNNVAIATKYALKTYPEIVKKVAIIDIDVHHGNGTEEVICKGKLDASCVFFFSIHLYDKSPSYDFYPGSGRQDILPHNVVNVPIMPLWKRVANREKGDIPKFVGQISTRSRSSASQTSGASSTASTPQAPTATSASASTSGDTPQADSSINDVASPHESSTSVSGTPRAHSPLDAWSIGTRYRIGYCRHCARLPLI